MQNELSKEVLNNKVLKTRNIVIPIVKDGVPVVKNGKVQVIEKVGYLEEVYELSYYQGTEVKTVRVNNLNEVFNVNGREITRGRLLERMLMSENDSKMMKLGDILIRRDKIFEAKKKLISISIDDS